MKRKSVASLLLLSVLALLATAYTSVASSSIIINLPEQPATGNTESGHCLIELRYSISAPADDELAHWRVSMRDDQGEVRTVIDASIDNLTTKRGILSKRHESSAEEVLPGRYGRSYHFIFEVNTKNGGYRLVDTVNLGWTAFLCEPESAKTPKVQVRINPYSDATVTLHYVCKESFTDKTKIREQENGLMTRQFCIIDPLDAHHEVKAIYVRDGVEIESDVRDDVESEPDGSICESYHALVPNPQPGIWVSEPRHRFWENFQDDYLMNDYIPSAMWEWNETFTDGPVDSGTVTICVRREGETEWYDASFPITVENAPPWGVPSQDEITVFAGETFGVSFDSVYDPSPVDRDHLTYRVDCDNTGPLPPFDVADLRNICTANSYAGQQVVSVWVVDKDGGVSEQAYPFTVNVLPTDSDATLAPLGQSSPDGDIITYDVTISNNGPSTAFINELRLSFDDTSLAKLNLAAQQNDGCYVNTFNTYSNFDIGCGFQLAALEMGTTLPRTLTVPVAADAEGIINATVCIVAFYDRDTSNNCQSVTIELSEPPTPPLTAAISAMPTEGTAPLVVNFSSADSTGEITDYVWDFDNDGLSDSNEANPQHRFRIAGTYTTRLTVSGPGGSDTAETTITVQEPPVERFDIEVQVFNDSNYDGVWDANEQALPNRRVCQGEECWMTDSNGLVRFSRPVNTDGYPICQDVPYGWIVTQPQIGIPTNGQICQTATAAAGSPARLTFGNAVLEVLHFALIDSDADAPIPAFGRIPQNATIDLNALGVCNINIQAVTNPSGERDTMGEGGTVGSVQMTLTKDEDEIHEDDQNYYPYALFTDNNGDYAPWVEPTRGKYQVTAIPYTEKFENGLQGYRQAVDFTLIPCGSGVSITSFSLIDAQTDQVIRFYEEIQQGAVLDASALPENLNIRANLLDDDQDSDDDQYEGISIVFDLTGPISRREKQDVAPFSLFSDNNGDYDGRPFPSGDYVLSASAYNGQENASEVLTLRFSVVNSTATALPGIEQIRIGGEPLSTALDYPTFEWVLDGAPPARFRLVVADEEYNRLFNEDLYPAQVCNGTCTYTPTIGDMEYGLQNGRYFWWMGVPDANGEMVYSTQSSFEVYIPPPYPPQQRTADVQDNGQVTFTWQEDPRASWYHLWVGHASDMSSVHEEWVNTRRLGCHESTICTVTIDLSGHMEDQLVWYLQAYGAGGYSQDESVGGWTEGRPFRP